MRTCSKCHKQFQDEFEFCPYCGIELLLPDQMLCSQCNRVIKVEFKFCPYCGQNTSTEDSKVPIDEIIKDKPDETHPVLEASEELIALMPAGFPVEKLLELEARAKTNGNILSDSEVNDILPASVTSPEAIDFMMEYLQSKRINIIYPMDDDEEELPSPAEEDSCQDKPVEEHKTPDSEGAVDFKLLREKLNEVLNTLSSREQEVLELRFGLKDGRQRTLEEVGKHFGVTRERIRQIEAKALRRLRSKR